MAAAAVSTPVAWLRCIPQSSAIIEAVRRSQQLEEQLQLAQSQQPRCSYPACAAAAVKWCEECGGEMCSAHDASWHGGGLRSTTQAHFAGRSCGGAPGANGSGTGSGGQSTPSHNPMSSAAARENRQGQRSVSGPMRTSHSEAQGHLRLELGMKLMQMKAEQSLLQKQAEADLAAERTALPQLRLLNRLNQMSDADAIAQEAALNALLKSAPPAARSPVATPISHRPMCCRSVSGHCNHAARWRIHAP